jgi:hypothetical protein
MADAGLILACVTLPAQLFSGCVLAYNTIADIREVGQAAKLQFLLFKVQHTRFLVWGQHSDVCENGMAPENVSDPVYQTVVSTLVEIQSLLEDVARICSRYGLERIDEIPPDQRQESEREIRRQATMVDRVQRSCSLSRRMRWVVRDHPRFANLVTRLTQFNDALYQFCPIRQRPSLTLAIEAETLARTIIDEGALGVQSMRVAAAQAAGLQIQDLGRRAAAFIAGSQRELMEQSDPMTNFRPTPNLLMSIQQISLVSGIPNDIPEKRDWVQIRSQYGPNHSPLRSVIEWRPFDPMKVSGPLKSALQHRIESLVQMLQQEPKPRCFRVLNCLGYLEDNTRPRFGIVLRFPRECEQDPDCVPQSLFQRLSSVHRIPYLGDRFELAAFLSESLYEFHISGWLHKSINSHNILFFQHENQGTNHNTADRNSSSPFSLKNPYFTGFISSRPDDPNAVSSERIVEPELGIYRHPEVQGISGQSAAPFHVSHDTYSLGTVLLEIGLWTKLRKLYYGGGGGLPVNSMSSNDFRNLLLNKYVAQLGPVMGERYMVAVRKCLDGRFDGLSGFRDHERDQPDYILNLKRSFYWEVVRVLQDVRV